MCGKSLVSAVFLVYAGAAMSSEPSRAELKDPYFGEALFYARQGDYFDAIARLDAELIQHYGVDDPKLDTLSYHINEAEFDVGDLELSYRMHRRAGRAIKAVIEGNVSPDVRNEAIYRLARIYFQKEQYTNALHTIERIEGEVPSKIVNDVAFLRGQIYMAVGRFAEAQAIFASLEGKAGYEGFATYNLGVSLFAQGQEAAAFEVLDRAGRRHGNDRAEQAIEDKSNLVLGRQLLEQGDPEAAKQYFDRVHLEGPFSNRALLGSGWANVRLENYQRALVPWTMLVSRNTTDPSVQEAMLGLPYAYAKLGLYGKSAVLYGGALEAIDGELDKLDASIKSIQDGKFLEALVREEINKDYRWVIRLRELPDAPETWYLMDLMASHDFQSSLQNYLDLEQLRKKLESWEGSYDAYEEMIALRRQYYEPLLPSIDASFRKLDSRMRLRLEQRDRLDKRLNSMLVSPRPEFLATAEERIIMERLRELEDKAGNDATSHRRIDRLKGYLLWNIRTQYDARLTTTFEDLAGLAQEIERLQEIYGSFVRARQAASQSYEGYDEQIRHLRINTRSAMANVKTLMARQGHMLEVMAVNELVRRRQTLEQSQVQARFAMAESYDRATMRNAPGAAETKQPEPGKGGE